jgi:hypothetical protein
MTTIDQRMKALRIDMPPDVGERHLASVAHELRSPHVAHVQRPTRSPVVRRLASLAAAAGLVLVPVAALGAERSVPGDLLYPVKQSTEWARSLADPDVRAIHRVQELEIVIARGAPIEIVGERLADASEVAADSPALMARIDRAREQVRERYGNVGDQGARDGVRGGESGSTGGGNPDATVPQSTPPTTAGSGQPERGLGGTGTTTTLSRTTTTEGSSPGTTVRSQDRDRSGTGWQQP